MRATNPSLSIALFTDRADAGAVFDRVEPVTAPHVRSKVDHLPRTPFAETLYLDTDTRVLGDLSDLYDVLGRFELAIAERAYVRATRSRAVWRHVVPAAFPEHNGGVLLYRHGFMLGDDGLLSLSQAQTAVEAAVEECDRFYPAFQFILWGDKTPAEALASALVDAAGEA